MERKESLLERASQALELPGDALGGMPRIELKSMNPAELLITGQILSLDFS